MDLQKKPEGMSLNDTLLVGPALQPDLIGVLMKVRTHQVTVVADVEKTFLQIKINEKDKRRATFSFERAGYQSSS